MKLSDGLSIVGVFVLAVLIVVGATAGVAVLSGTATKTTSAPDAPAFENDTLLPDPVADRGSVAVAETGTEKTVVVDLSHGNDVTRAQMQPLVNSLVRGGHDVRFFTGGSAGGGFAGSAGSSALNGSLRGADAFVAANPKTAYSGTEVDGIEAFANAGGRVLLLADAPTGGSSSSSVPPIIPSIGSASSVAASGQPTNVAARFGITFGSGYLYDMSENANNFKYIYAETAGESTIGTGAERTVFRAAVPIVTSDEAETVLAGEDVRNSSTRENGSYGLVVRNGNVTAVGDTWFLSPEAATLADNERLVGNVAAFLTDGEKAAGAPRASEGPGSDVDFPGSGVTTPIRPPPTNETDTPGTPTNETDTPGTPTNETVTETPA
jgi:hypothetical protein